MRRRFPIWNVLFQSCEPSATDLKFSIFVAEKFLHRWRMGVSSEASQGSQGPFRFCHLNHHQKRDMDIVVPYRRAILWACLAAFSLFTLPLSATGNFTISASPSSLTIAQGSQGTSKITTKISGGFNSFINLSASAVPPGITVSFNPQFIQAPGAGVATMTITVAGFTKLETYPITVTGSGGGIKQSVIVMVTVTSQGQPNFAISASPASLTIAQGNLGTSTITSTISGGFNSSISLSASGMPGGVGVSFNPPAIPAPGAGTSTMTITVSGSTPLGTYPITVTRNGGE